MLQSPQGQAPLDHELGALPLDWVEPKPLPKICYQKKEETMNFEDDEMVVGLC